MKILTVNELQKIGVVFSSAQGSANYPARNLVDDFLRVRYQANNATDSIVITLNDPISVNCFFLGYIGNIDALEISFYSGGVVQALALGAIHVTGDGFDRDIGDGSIKHFGNGFTDYFADYGGEQYTARHFDQLSFIDEIRINISGTSPIYIGGIAAGTCHDVGDPATDIMESPIDNSLSVTSPRGQRQQSYAEPLDTGVFTFRERTREETLRIKDEIYRPVGLGGFVWVDYFPENHEFRRPGYAIFSAPPAIIKAGRRYDITLSFEEAR